MARVNLLCSCGLPWGYVDGDTLHVVSRHHGEKHENHVSLSFLQWLCDPEHQQALMTHPLQPGEATPRAAFQIIDDAPQKESAPDGRENA